MYIMSVWNKMRLCAADTTAQQTPGGGELGMWRNTQLFKRLFNLELCQVATVMETQSKTRHSYPEIRYRDNYILDTIRLGRWCGDLTARGLWV